MAVTGLRYGAQVGYHQGGGKDGPQVTTNYSSAPALPRPPVPCRYPTSKAGGGVAVTVLRNGYRLTTTRSIGSILCPAMASMCPCCRTQQDGDGGTPVGGGLQSCNYCAGSGEGHHISLVIAHSEEEEGVGEACQVTMIPGAGKDPPYLIVAHGKDASVHCGVQRLDAPVQHLGETRHILHLRAVRDKSSTN